MSTAGTAYDNINALREAARPMDEAWDRLMAAERAGRPREELVQLAEEHQRLLDGFVAWQRERSRQAR